MNDDKPEDRFPSDSSRGRARERMSADYDDAPPRRPAAGRVAAPTGGAVSQALSQFLNSDTGTRRLVYGAAGLGGLLLVSIGGWALVGHHQSGIPVIGPPSVAMRTKPADPGGMQLDGVTMPEADDGQAHPVPAPEKPNPTALAAQYGQEAAKTDAASSAATVAAGAQANADQAADAPALKGADQPAPAGPDAAQAGGPDVAQPTILPEAGSGSDDDSAAGDSAAASAPAATPARAPQPAKTVTKTPAVAAPAPAKATAEKQLPPPSPVPAPTGGKYRVQLAALQTEAQAQQEWSRLKTRYPALFGDRTPVVEKIQRDNAVFYRLRVGGFASTAETRTFCGAVRDRGLACAQVH